MNRLAGYSAVLQVHRTALLDAVREYVQIGGIALQVPFGLALPLPPPPDSSKIALDVPRRPLDLVIRQVDLRLDPGQKTGSILLRIAGGAVRTTGGNVLIRDGAVELPFEWAPSSWASLTITGVGLDPAALAAGAAIPNFASLASDLLKQVVSFSIGQAQNILPPPDGQAPDMASSLQQGATSFNLDADTLCTVRGIGDSGQLARFVTGEFPVAFGLGEPWRGMLMAESVAASFQLKAAGDLPPPLGGGGGIQRSEKGADITITSLDLVYMEGRIGVRGAYKAKGTCWHLDDGTLSQDIIFAVNAQGAVVPTLVPEDPILTGDAKVNGLCKFGIGLITTVLVGAGWGIGAYIASGLLPKLVSVPKPDKRKPPDAVPLPTINRAFWRSLTAGEDGFLALGFRFAAPPEPPAPADISLVVKAGETIVVSRQKFTVRAAFSHCEARDFEVTRINKTDSKEVQVRPTLLVEPVAYKWSVNGIPLKMGEDKLETRAALTDSLPLSQGTFLPDQPVEVAYSLGPPVFLPFAGSPDGATFSVGAGGMNFAIDLRVDAIDATGRSVAATTRLSFVRTLTLTGEDYNTYATMCAAKAARDIPRFVPTERPLPGGREPVEVIEDMARQASHALSINPAAAAALLKVAARSAGGTALNAALLKTLPRG